MAIDAAHDGERREIVIRYGMDLVRRGRHDVVELLEAEAAREETRANPDVDAALWALLGTAYVGAHRPDDAREAARRALIRLPGVQDDDLRARVLHQASYVALNDGDVDAAKSLAERALARADETFLYDLAARALSVLFNVAMLHDDDVPAARRALLRLEEAGRKAGSDALRLYAILNAYAIEVDAGDTAALERLDDQLREMQVLLTRPVSEALLPGASAARRVGRPVLARVRSARAGRREAVRRRSAPRTAGRRSRCTPRRPASTPRRATRSRAAAREPARARPPQTARRAHRGVHRARRDPARTTTRRRSPRSPTRAPRRTAPGRFAALVETIAAFYDCGTGQTRRVPRARRRARRARRAASSRRRALHRQAAAERCGRTAAGERGVMTAAGFASVSRHRAGGARPARARRPHRRGEDRRDAFRRALRAPRPPPRDWTLMSDWVETACRRYAGIMPAADVIAAAMEGVSYGARRRRRKRPMQAAFESARRNAEAAIARERAPQPGTERHEAVDEIDVVLDELVTRIDAERRAHRGALARGVVVVLALGQTARRDQPRRSCTSAARA